MLAAADPAPSQERQHGTRGRIDPRLEVRLRARQGQRRPAGLADDDGGSAGGARLERMTAMTRPGSPVAEGGDGAMNQGRVTPRRLGGRELRGPRLAGVEILDEDICLVQEPRQLQPVAGLRERERDAELVGVEETVEPAPLGVRDAARERAVTPRGITIGRLDLDHPRSQLGEGHRAERSGEDACQVHDQQTGKWSRIHELVLVAAE